MVAMALMAIFGVVAPTIASAQAIPAPVITSIPQQTVAVGGTVTFTVVTTDPNNVGLGNMSLSISDPSGTLPADLLGALDSITGVFSWTPTVAGTYTFDIIADDGVAVDAVGNATFGQTPVTIIVTGGVVPPVTTSLAIDPITSSSIVTAITGTSVNVDLTSLMLTINDITTGEYWNDSSVPFVWSPALGYVVGTTNDPLTGNWSYDTSTIPFTNGDTYQISMDAFDLPAPGNPVSATPVTFTFGNIVVTPVLTSVTVAPAASTINVAGTQQLTANPLDQNTAAFVGATITWSSSDTAIATVDASGLVTGVAAGSATITATAVSGVVTVTGTASVTVVAVPPTSVPTITTINVTPVNPLIAFGTTKQFVATGVDQNGAVLTTQPTFTWTSSDTAVGTVDANTGMFTAIAAGITTITATDAVSTLTGTTVATVSDISPVNPSVVVGSTIQFTFATTSESATTTWSSSNPAVATINSATGLATSVAVGTTVITVNYDDDGDDSDDISTTTLTVTAAPVVPSSSGGSSRSSGVGFYRSLFAINNAPRCASGDLFDTNDGTRCPGGQVLGESSFKFLNYLKMGMSNDSVRELQERLRKEGYFTFPTSTGYFGSVTFNAVKSFQRARGLPSTGFVGPMTIGELNK